MTRVLWWAAWIFGCIAAFSYLMLWREAFVATAVLAALSCGVWGFLVHPEAGDNR